LLYYHEEHEGKRQRGLSDKVIGCAIEVHKTLGSGLLESTYQQCLAHELSINQIEFKIE
jgi:GxxExxY protein